MHLDFNSYQMIVANSEYEVMQWLRCLLFEIKLHPCNLVLDIKRQRFDVYPQKYLFPILEDKIFISTLLNIDQNSEKTETCIYSDVK